MSHDRRFVCALILIWPCAAAISAESPVRVPPREEILRTLRPEHPRLHVTPGDFSSLKSRIADNATLARWYAHVRERAEEILRSPPCTYRIPDGKRLLSTSRSVLERVYCLAFVYLLERDEKYLERTWQELDAAANFKDWNPRHFLDTAEMTHAFAIGYDWLYQDWNEPRRAAIRAAIIRHGLTPGLKSYRGEESYGWFVRAESNWNQVCNGGLTAGALAIADDEPQLAAEIVHAALQSIQLAMHQYAPDGAYHEGPGYWGYGTSYNVLMIAVLESALGTDFGLTRFEGFEKTVRFPMQLTGPTGDTFNFADASAGRPGHTSAMLWLARRFGHADVAHFTRRIVQGSPLDILCYDPVVEDAARLAPETCTYWRGVEAVSLRTGWDDPNAAWIAFKGDRPVVNHGQADLGSFVLEMSGHRWATDLGADDYNLPGYFDGRKRRWHFYRNRAEGHNTLVINPGQSPDQTIDGTASVVRFKSDGPMPFGIMDLTPAYAKDAKQVHRGIALSDRTVAIVQDEIELKQPSTVWWFMHTPAGISLDADKRTATLAIGGIQLTARLIEPVSASFSITAAEPLPGSPTVDGQKVNKAVRKLAIELRDFSAGRVCVAFGPADRTRSITARPLNDW